VSLAGVCRMHVAEEWAVQRSIPGRVLYAHCVGRKGQTEAKTWSCA